MRSLNKRIFYTAAGLVAIVGAAWASTGISFNWQPAPEQIAGNAAPDLAIGASKKRGPSLVDYGLLDRRLNLLAADPGMVGLAVGVIEDGEIRFLKGYGVTEAGTNDPVTTDTIFRWASVSKGVAGDMIAKLSVEGKLSLYEPVARYAPSLRLPAGNEHKATVSDLLSHRLGLFGHASDPELEDGGDARQLRARLSTLNAICPPGTCHAYQNVAYDAASDVVEKVTGKSYQQSVREQLFLPLGMASATLTRDGLVGAKSWARPHRGGKTSRAVEVTESYYRVPAAGGVNSSIKDLALWARAQMGEAPEVLSQRALADAHSPRAATPGEQSRMRKFRERLSKASYGLGWRSYDYSGNNVVGHRGGVTGYRSLVMFDPVRKSGVVAMWNSSSGKPSGIEFEVMDMIYKLEPRDWLDLDAKMRVAAAPPVRAAS